MIIVRWQLIRQEFKTNQNEKGTRLGKDFKDIKLNVTSIAVSLYFISFQLIDKIKTFYFIVNM